MPNMLKFMTPVLLVMSAQLAIAQTDLDEREAQEQIKQQAFRDGIVSIVGSLNAGSFMPFTKAINRDDFIERIFGLRLIDGGIKRDFREDMKEPVKWNDFIASLYFEEAKEGIRATLLIVESRGDRGRAVVRFDMSFFRANYLEYDLILDDKGRMIIVDWNDYFWGHGVTERMGLTMVQARPNPNAARKLVDYPNVRESQVFQIMEILKATRDRNLDRYEQIMDGLDERMKSQRVIIMLGLDAARTSRKRRDQRRALERLDEHFPDDPLYSLALLDLYIPDERYQDSLDGLSRLQKHLRVDDALVNARQSSILLAMGNVEEAQALAMKSVTQEPNLELGWWSVFRAQVTAEDFVAAIESLEILEDNFGHSLGPDELAKDPMFQKFMLSSEYRVWFEESD